MKKLTLLTSNLTSAKEFYAKIPELTIHEKSDKIISFSVGHTVPLFSGKKRTAKFLDRVKVSDTTGAR